MISYSTASGEWRSHRAAVWWAVAGSVRELANHRLCGPRILYPVPTADRSWRGARPMVGGIGAQRWRRRLPPTGSRLANPQRPSRPDLLLSRPDGGFELSLRAPSGASALRGVHLLRGTPVQFAAILPGDGVAEVVLTSGISSFL